LPYLEIDGEKLPQSISIARYLAREFKLNGDDNIEQAKADAVVDTALDLLNAYFSKGLYKTDRNDEAWTVFRNDDVKKHFANIEKLIGLYGSNGYSSSNKLLWSDIFLMDVVQQITKGDLSSLEGFPNLKKVVAIVEGHPNISAYLAKRKESQF
jgi:glutathione S-transferase